jgi:hypothetical protein
MLNKLKVSTPIDARTILHDSPELIPVFRPDTEIRIRRMLSIKTGSLFFICLFFKY